MKISLLTGLAATALLTPAWAQKTGPDTTQSSYILPVGPGAALTETTSLLSVGDLVGSYRLSGNFASASDDHRIRRVVLRVNGGAFHAVEGTRQWSASVSLRRGQNVLVARAIDDAGQSCPLSRRIVIRK